MKSLLWPILLLVAIAAGAGGCGPIKVPRLPQRIVTPGTAVTLVRLGETGPQAARYDIDVSIYNPNEFPLPLTFAQYKLTVAGVSYESDALPRATLPASGRVTVTLPAVLVGSDGPPGRGAYEVSGRITMTPEGEVRRLLYQLGFPKPKMKFAGQGEIGPAMDAP